METSENKNQFHSPRLCEAFAKALGTQQTGDDAARTDALVKALLADAIRGRASDVHLDPRGEEIRIRFRTDGTVHEIVSLSQKLGLKLIRYLKVHSNLDPSPCIVPADSHFECGVEGQALDIRVACAPCIYGDKLALRLLRRSPVTQRLVDIGLSIKDRERIERWLGDISGMLLVAGPVGSGKTTTLYALLAELNLTQRHIITIEDPVEYHLENINQIEVNPKRGLTFEEGLRSILRLDPDYILLGEIRDKESALIAMEAATTGHVVLTTMHARNVAGVITSLRSLEIPDYEIAASIALIVGQRLVRKLCTRCRKLGQPAEHERRLLEALGEKIPDKVWHPVGCAECANTGYFERTGIFEVLPVDESIYDLIISGADEHAIRGHVRKEGLPLLMRDGLNKAAEGITDISELTRIGAQTYLDRAKQ